MSADKALMEARERKLIKRAERLQERMGESILTVDDYITGRLGDYDPITEVRFKVRYLDEGDILVVVKRKGEAGKTIGFGSADTLGEAVISLANRLKNGSIKWREDTPYDGWGSNGSENEGAAGG